MNKSTYHHGDLANALVDAALALVEQDGAQAVSLRELAQSLGVSRAAPYRHFADRDALLAAVAARGFEDLIVVYQAALNSGGDGLARLQAFGRAYFDFAVRRPGLYRLMFESDFLSRNPPPAVLIPPANTSYQLVWRAIEGAYPDADPVEVKMRAVIMTSTAHGFLMLDHAGRFKPFMYEPLSHDEMVKAVLRTAMGAD
jgi:AcrR family transcriptional regulator